MTRPPAGAPRATWLAAGAGGAAACAFAGVPPAVALVAGLALLAVGLWLARARPGPGVVATAAGAGAALLALRVLLGPPAPEVPPLPDGSGAWRAVVLSVGSPRDGAQVARLALLVGDARPQVAATLPAYPAVRTGSTVEVAGRLEPAPDDDPYGEYLRRTGAAGTLQARRLTIIAPEAGLTLQGARDASGDALQAALPEPEAGLAAGILVGLRERVDRQLAADFATAGASHVVAISGWNIAIVGGLIAALLRGRPRRIVALAVGATILAYVVAAGASPSVVRAAVMAGVVLTARESGRAGRAAPALALAAALMLFAEPEMIGDAGFRLSVAATAGLLAWATPLGRWIGTLGGGRVPGWLAESLGVSLAAQAATLPDVLVTFGRLSIVAPVVNLLVVPLVPAAMAAGVLAMGGGAAVMLGVPGFVATVVGLPGWLILHVIVAVIRLAAGIPFAAVAIPPELAPVVGVVAAIGVLCAPVAIRRLRARRRRRGATRRPRPGAPSATGPPRRDARLSRLERSTLAAALVVIAVSTLAIGDVARREARLVMLDVGQGDGILVEGGDGSRMLVDGGPDPERLLIQLDGRIPPWDRRIDVLVLTHPHEDHVAGLVRVLERYRVGRVFEPGMRGPGPGWQAWDAELRRDRLPRGTLSAGARLRLGSVRLTVLWPEPGVSATPAATGRGINDVSIVMLGEVNGRTFLLTGDAEDDVDPALLARGLPHLDVLKVAHHGSATATTEAFLGATRPTVALISVGAHNDYGHPAPATLGRLRDVGARVYRTDRDGTTEVGLGREGMSVRTSGPVTKAAAVPARYDAAHARPDPSRGGPNLPVPRSARVVRAARVRRRGRRRLARSGGGRARRDDRRHGGRGRGPPPRRRQGRGPAARPQARRRLGRVAGSTRSCRARPARARPPRDPARRRCGHRAPHGGTPRGEDRRLRGQAGRPAARVDGRAVCVVAASLPHGARGPVAGRATRSGQARLGRRGRGSRLRTRARPRA
jgi:competence protein ComEC